MNINYKGLAGLDRNEFKILKQRMMLETEELAKLHARLKSNGPLRMRRGEIIELIECSSKTYSEVINQMEDMQKELADMYETQEVEKSTNIQHNSGFKEHYLAEDYSSTNRFEIDLVGRTEQTVEVEGVSETGNADMFSGISEGDKSYSPSVVEMKDEWGNTGQQKNQVLLDNSIIYTELPPVDYSLGKSPNALAVIEHRQAPAVMEHEQQSEQRGFIGKVKGLLKR